MPVRRGAVLVLAVGLTLAPLPARADTALPSDPSAQGTVGLCNRAGQPVTGGSIDDKPFVWRAVGSQAAQSPYDGDGASATLYAFQPRPDTTPDRWSGDTLTATSRYTNTAHPMAQATQLDFTLSDLLAEYPPQVDGLMQLRLYTSSAAGADPSRYAATYIRVTGRTWSLAQDVGSFSCTDGSATSTEVDAGIVDARGNAVGTAAASLSASASAAAASATASPTGSRGSSPSTSPGGTASATPSATDLSPAAAAGTSPSRGDGGSATGWLFAGAVVVVGLAAGTVWWRRRRQAAAV